jgi:hypothetical protein
MEYKDFIHVFGTIIAVYIDYKKGLRRKQSLILSLFFLYSIVSWKTIDNRRKSRFIVVRTCWWHVQNVKKISK